MKSVKLKSGVKMSLHPGGSIWASPNGKEWYHLGYIYKDVFNTCLVETKATVGYWPVSRPLVKFAKRFGIKAVRIERQVDKKTERGWARKFQYGYAPVKKVLSLLDKRKSAVIASGKVILLKDVDLEIRGE